MMNKHLLRRKACNASNPQDLDDIECALTYSTSSSSFDYSDNDQQENTNEPLTYDSKKDDITTRRSAQLLSDLSPFSRRIVRFVTPTHPKLPDRCTSELITVAAVRIIPSLLVLLILPFLMWDGYPTEWSLLNIYPLFRHASMVWSSLLHCSAWPIVVGTLVTAICMPRGGFSGSSSSLVLKSRYLSVPSPTTTQPSTNNHKSIGVKILEKVNTSLPGVIANVTSSNWKMSMVLSITFSTFVIVNMILHMGYPHVLWNPFIWGWYHVYLPKDIIPSLQGACLDFEKHSTARQPLCLSEDKWNELSSGQLSSYNPDDVMAVQKGLDYLQNQSGGLIINALARNVVDSIPALKQNVEGLLPFFKDGDQKKKNLSLVIFENDSDDGTRDAFQRWSDIEASRKDGGRYTVDLMSCGPKNPNCELGIMDRYDANFFTNKKASGVGKLGEFRQILLDYIMKKDEYKEYSHMVVLDVDLGTSLSPLGLLHSLGLENGIGQDYAVATTSSQVWPGTGGTIIPPYDLSAFRPKETKDNKKVRGMHQAFCELMPAGDRWRNMCEACSPMQLFMIQSANDVTTHQEQPYEVVSAFNGLTMYPMSLIRESPAKYDAGDDGQRCEHVGFHLSLQKNMFVNPKWTMNLRPEKPGGPTGFKGIKTLIFAILGRPNVMFYIVLGNMIFFMSMVYPMWMIGTSIKSLLMLITLSKRDEKKIYSKSSYDMENNSNVVSVRDRSSPRRQSVYGEDGERKRSNSVYDDGHGIDTREM